jgi:hypothetical protein
VFGHVESRWFGSQLQVCSCFRSVEGYQGEGKLVCLGWFGGEEVDAR